LVKEFADRDDRLVEEVIDLTVGRYEQARIRDYVPLLVERDARALLGRPARP